MSKRINVMLSDMLNDKLDCLSERYGVSKSSIVGFVVGQYIDNLEKMNAVVYGKDDENGLIFDVISKMGNDVGN